MGLFGAKKHSTGKTIAELRKEKGWTQIELAEKLQVSDKAISKWEKDNGAPSVEFFPALAELFGVSIDYIMTGKKPEPEIITMSKIELCAKNGDINLLAGIDCKFKDENGKSIIDYILQYKNYKVFVDLCEKNRQNICYFKILDAINLAILSNRLDLLCGARFSLTGTKFGPFWQFDNEKELLGLLPKAIEKNISINDSVGKDLCILTDEFFKMIVCDNRINQQTMDILLGNQNDRNCVWYHVFPYLIHQSYLNNKTDMLNRLLSLSVKNNDFAYKNIKLERDTYNGGFYNYVPHFFFMGQRNSKGGHGLVRILEETIKLALNRGDFANFEKFNDINIAIIKYYDFKPYIASNDEIRMAKLKTDKTVSKDEITIQSTIHDGIMNLDELLATKNSAIIKKALSNNSIHPIEPFCKLLQSKNWRALFEYAVDNGNNTIANAAIANDVTSIEKELVSLYLKSIGYTGYPYVNGRELKLRGSSPIRQSSMLVNRAAKNMDIASIIEYLNAFRQQILSDFSYEEERNKVTTELTKEYFETELKKGNAEIVIIKLCVRLESILRASYHYEGDFSEMLEKYCSEHGYEDDGWGYNQEAKCVKYLQKLRMCRNSIVHAERRTEMPSIEELQYCIDYICKMK